MKKQNDVELEGPIEIGDINKVLKDETPLPGAYKWSNLNLTDEEELKELYNFLNENYVEDKDAMFRFDYQPEFLKWALMVPHYFEEWILAV